MERVAEVLINMAAKNVAKSFSYLVPEEFDFLSAGWRALVPFGNRQAEGFVVSVGDGDGAGLKPIAGVIDSEPWFTEHMLAVAAWLSDYYLCTPAEAMRLFIPGKAGLKTGTVFRAGDGEGNDFFNTCPASYREVFQELKVRGPRTILQLAASHGKNVANILRKLAAAHLVVAEAVVRSTAAPIYRTYWQLAVSIEQATVLAAEFKRKPAQRRVLEVLSGQKKVTAEELKQLKISRGAVNALIEAGIIVAGRTRLTRDSYADFGGTAPNFQLSGDQRQALDDIYPAIDAKEHRSFLLYGVTGSGKTQLYIEAAARVRKQGRQAVVLVPEIALTGQIVSRFKEIFGRDVLVLHSKLSVGERHDTWQRLRSGEVGIVIGARSAVFAPVPDPGLFIIDEEHEFTYKQEESPHYHTRQVALKRAELVGAVVVMGSATPAVGTYYQAARGQHTLVSLSSRIDGALLPAVTVVDLRAELAAGRRSVISLPLRELLVATLEQSEQAIILLNRRGYATFVICRECGHVMRCAHCAVSLVYHSTSRLLRCHYCQASQPSPDVCPSCASRYIRYFGTGTQKVEEELTALLPGARIIRMDHDTTGGKMAHDRILQSFAAGKYDILLGTQMVAKGHDIKNVTAVGIISADTALNLPDFRAAERTFALITQAAGRAGRGDKPGQVVVQTYNPEHYAVAAAAKHDYPAFYACESECRQELCYPPYSRLIKITIQGSDAGKARRLADQAAADIKLHLTVEATSVIGPFPAPVAKISNVHRMHILIKTQNLPAATAAVRELGLPARGDIVIDVDPQSVL